MRRGFQPILEVKLERLKMLREWRRWAEKLAREFKHILGEVEVYAFGSAVEGRMMGGSDVDILVVSEKAPERLLERSDLVAAVEERLQLPLYHPFEVHLVNRREAEFYWRHIKKFEKIL